MGTDLTRRDYTTKFPASTDVRNQFVLHPLAARFLEMEDVHFHHNSAVLLPDFHTDAPDDDKRITALAVLATAYVHAKQNATEHMLVAGHTDTTGAPAYNLSLSLLRAQSVQYLLSNERGKWVDVALQRNKVEDHQAILKWADGARGYGCDPGPIDNTWRPELKTATEAFKRGYNGEFPKPIKVDGQINAETWGAFYDVYRSEIAKFLKTDDKALAGMSGDLHFLKESQKCVGCGLNFPIDQPLKEKYRSATNRRVEILFFQPGQEPKLDCHPSSGGCVPDKCEIYKIYGRQHIPVTPIAPPAAVRTVFAQLVWVDPVKLGTEHNFPEGLPVTVIFNGDPAQKLDVQTTADGKLKIDVAAGQTKLTLKFKSSATQYICTAMPTSTKFKGEKLIAEADVASAVADACKAFALPLDWSMDVSSWQVDKKQVTELIGLNDPAANVGTEEKPLHFLLDPNWQFLQFVFMDRMFIHSTEHANGSVSIPPILINGYRKAPPEGDKTTPPDTRSNWSSGDETINLTMQCLPWIIQKTDGAIEPKPDEKILLEFKTDAGTFIVSDSATSRKIEVITDADRLKAGPNRLKLYDLPVVWRSRKYFARPQLSKTSDFFEKLTKEQIQESLADSAPLVFSLDDILLVDESLDPIKLVAEDHATVFCNTFGDGDEQPNVSNLGVYKADDTQSHFSKDELLLTDARNYIADPAGWTRLVITKGWLLDVFDQRVADKAGRPVGARAAVRWFDPIKPKWAAGHDPALDLPPIMNKPFFNLQALFTQGFEETREDTRPPQKALYLETAKPYVNRFDPQERIGRFDLLMLRCCDVKDEAEKGIAMSYFRFAFTFPADAKKHLGGAQKPTASTTPDLQRTFINNVLANIPDRWNFKQIGTDEDGKPLLYNYGPGVIVPEDGGLKFSARVFWFTHELPEARAHQRFDVTGDGRAETGSTDGVGVLGDSDDASEGSGRFVVAHECGHLFGLPDEYIEDATSASYGAPGNACNTAGDPYLTDQTSMMEADIQVRGRYFWHIAEWMRTLPTFSSAKFVVEHGPFKGNKAFKLPRLAPNKPLPRTLYGWPLATRIHQTTAPHGLYDAYLHTLGRDDFGAGLLRLAMHLPDDALVDGILAIVIKIEFTTHTKRYDVSSKMLQLFQAKVWDRFNLKRLAKLTIGPASFENCLLYVSARFVCPVYINDKDYNSSMNLPFIDTTKPAEIAQNKAKYAEAVKDIHNFHAAHFTLKTQDKGTESFKDHAVVINFPVPKEAGAEPDYDVFVDAMLDRFTEMLGLTTDAFDTPASYEPIFRSVMDQPNGALEVR